MRAEQRAATREQILMAALAALAESGFDGVSTRTIAARANVSQGLLTYHFKSKDTLWRAAAEYLFRTSDAIIADALERTADDGPKEQRRAMIRAIVRFNAQHPEFTRFLLEQGEADGERSRWLVETYIRPSYEKFVAIMGPELTALAPHAFYVLAGGAGVVFGAARECADATGMDPSKQANIERHADYLAQLMVPDEPSSK